MRTKFNNPELSHIWANQTQPHGDGSSMFFRNETIYSYGYHFIIAKHLQNKEGQKCVFFNDRKYSNTTNKHQNLVWRAIPHGLPVFHVKSFFNEIEYSASTHKDNLTNYIQKAEEAKNKAIKANKNKMYYLQSVKNSLDNFEEYCQFFNITDLAQFNPILGHGLSVAERFNRINTWYLDFVVSDDLKKWQQKQEENRKKAEIKALEDAKEKIEAFRQFKISSIYANLGHYLLRYNKETQNIETSGGVKMNALIFLKAYNRLINNELNKGQHVGDFVFNGLENDIVSVGCHKIPMTEIQNVVSLLP